MLLVLAFTDFCLGGELLRPGTDKSDELSEEVSEVNNTESRSFGEKQTDEGSLEELGKLIAEQSCEFVRAAFDRDKARVAGMLSEDAEFMVSKDNASYIRYTFGELHVEGYMATDKKLADVRQSWFVMEDDGTIISEVEVFIEGEENPQTWYIHYRKSLDQWEIFMLENGM